MADHPYAELNGTRAPLCPTCGLLVADGLFCSNAAFHSMSKEEYARLLAIIEKYPSKRQAAGK